jgi:leucyl aminopeptidase
MNVTFAKRAIPDSGAAIVLAADKGKLLASADRLDAATGGQLAKAIKAVRFTGGVAELAEILAPSGTRLTRLVVMGVGKPEELDALAGEKIGAAAVKRLLKSGEASVTLVLDPIEGSKVQEADFAAHICFGALLESYRFDSYFTKQKPKDKPTLAKFGVATAAANAARRRFAERAAVGEGVVLARNLVMEPANVLYPEEFARRCKKLADRGVEVEVLGEAQMRRLKMGALLGVGQGSERESQLVVMRWNGAAKSKKPVAFVGKGVTFDTGGISIKPAGGMEEMKGDMGGAAAVTGLMHALASRKAKVNAVGVIGIVENMPSGKAQRPGDIVTSMSGQTIEVINTDAEGRLVLADALWYTQDRFKPQFMIDLATLTGAIIISLGHEYAGLFSNNDELAERITAAAKTEGEPVWRLPLGEAYDKGLRSKFADMKNVGGRDGGSIVAAQFLKRFVNDVTWAHLDIAGTAWKSEARPTAPAWATGYGVRLLNRLIADYYEG